MDAINHRNVLNVNIISPAIFHTSRTLSTYSAEGITQHDISDLAQMYADLFEREMRGGVRKHRKVRILVTVCSEFQARNHEMY
jgi:hypothetical protein